MDSSIDPQTQNPSIKRLADSNVVDDQHSKKARHDQQIASATDANKTANQPNSPSKVIHIRGLPHDVQESELANLCMPFGRIAQLVILRQKQQALVEMQDLSAATLLVQYYSSIQPNLRGLPIYLQFSNKPMITAPQKQPEGPHNVLLVSVLNMIYPITIEILQQIFSKYGSVLRIALVQKSTVFQALIQFSSPQESEAAKTALDGQNIYSGCCTLKIQFSQLSTLQIKANNERTRDFTQPNLPTSTSTHSQQNNGSNFADTPMDHNYGSIQPMNPPFPAMNQFATGAFQNPQQMMNPGGPCVLIVSNLLPDKVNPDVLFKLFGVYGDVIRVKILFNKPDTALIQFNTSQQATTALQHLNQVPLFGKSIQVNFSKHQNVQMPKGNEEEPGKYTRDYTNSPLHRYRIANSKNYQHITPPSPVLFVANVPTAASDEQLRELFGGYGTLTSLRTHTKDNKRLCWAQMASIGDAVQALVILHDYKMFEGGPNLRISFSAK